MTTKFDPKAAAVKAFIKKAVDNGDTIDDIKTALVRDKGANLSEANKAWAESGFKASRSTADWLTNYISELEKAAFKTEAEAKAYLVSQKAPKGVIGRWLRVFDLTQTIRSAK